MIVVVQETLVVFFLSILYKQLNEYKNILLDADICRRGYTYNSNKERHNT